MSLIFRETITKIEDLPIVDKYTENINDNILKILPLKNKKLLLLDFCKERKNYFYFLKQLLKNKITDMVDYYKLLFSYKELNILHLIIFNNYNIDDCLSVLLFLEYNKHRDINIKVMNYKDYTIVNNTYLHPMAIRITDIIPHNIYARCCRSIVHDVDQFIFDFSFDYEKILLKLDSTYYVKHKNILPYRKSIEDDIFENCSSSVEDKFYNVNKNISYLMDKVEQLETDNKYTILNKEIKNLTDKLNFCINIQTNLPVFKTQIISIIDENKNLKDTIEKLTSRIECLEKSTIILNTGYIENLKLNILDVTKDLQNTIMQTKNINNKLNHHIDVEKNAMIDLKYQNIVIGLDIQNIKLSMRPNICNKIYYTILILYMCLSILTFFYFYMKTNYHKKIDSCVEINTISKYIEN